jgi:hypothetical protein
MLRLEIVKRILCRVLHRPGIASSLLPALLQLPGIADGAITSAGSASTHIKARGNILLVLLPQGIPVADDSGIHPLSLNTLPKAAATAGAAAAHRYRRGPKY